jgi:asparagine synthase (glutamine-hydrolysing)
VTVALNGDGGDESFAGYERYAGNRLAETIQKAPATRLAGRVIPDSLSPKSRLRKAKRFLTAAADPMPIRYGTWVGFFGEQEKAELYSGEFKSTLNGWRPDRWMASLFDEAAGCNPVDRAMAVDVRSYLPYDLLVKVDITSMANSLEARSPFLDHEVMEFAARLPVSLKLRGRRSKYLVKRAFADLLPEPILRRRKAGFGVPISAWLRGPLRPLVEDALLSEQFAKRGYFDPLATGRLVKQHLEGRADYGSRIWNLMMLELWHRVDFGD